MRTDWNETMLRWMDSILKGKDTGVEKWPDVQVQSSTGQWWAVKEYPTIGGRVGHLALGPDGQRRPEFLMRPVKPKRRAFRR